MTEKERLITSNRESETAGAEIEEKWSWTELRSAERRSRNRESHGSDTILEIELTESRESLLQRKIFCIIQLNYLYSLLYRFIHSTGSIILIIWYTLILSLQDGRHELCIPILPSNDLNRAVWIAFVKISASWSAYWTCIVFKNPLCSFSRTTWQSISTYFVRSWYTGLEAM